VKAATVTKDDGGFSMSERKEKSEMATDYTEKIAGLEEQIAQLENRRRELLQKNREKERKARTKRLIERGAILESLIDGADDMTNEQIQTLLEKALRVQGYPKKTPEVKQTEAAQSDGEAESGAAGTE
jgi:dynactin complex subunit